MANLISWETNSIHNQVQIAEAYLEQRAGAFRSARFAGKSQTETGRGRWGSLCRREVAGAGQVRAAGGSRAEDSRRGWCQPVFLSVGKGKREGKEAGDLHCR